MKTLPKFAAPAILLALLAVPARAAVAITTPELQQNSFLIRVAVPEQEFFFKDARKIANLSLQKYISAQSTEISRGAASAQYVTEMSFDVENSPLLVRIYAMEIFDPTQIQTSNFAKSARTKAKKVVNATTGTNVASVVEQLVVKTYPQTTHAKTLEIRLSTASEVEEFYEIFKDFLNRERYDFQYFGAIKSPNSKQKIQKTWLGIGSNTAPAKDWENAFKQNKILRNASANILVNGLSGLCFTIGVTSAEAAELEEKDVSAE